MSHWSSNTTPIKNLNLLKQGAEKVGLKVEIGDVVARGYGRAKQHVDAVVRGGRYDIGFKYNSATERYEVVADVWGWETEHGKGSYLKAINGMTDHYTAEEEKAVARRKGDSVRERVMEDGTIELEIVQHVHV